MRLIDHFLRRDSAGFWEGMASGAAILTTTYATPNHEAILPSLVAYTNKAYSENGIVFGAILARLSLFSEARFQYQRLSDKGLWGNNEDDGLVMVENPWPNGTTGELLARMIQDVDLAGNCYLWNAGDQLVRLRPDQVTIVSEEVTDGVITNGTPRTYRKVIGYYWDPEAPSLYGPSEKTQYFDVDEIVHWSPIPDPIANWRGMSWLTPVIREITADGQLTDYKSQYLNNAATPNMVVRYKQKLLPASIDNLRERMHERYGGVANAFKTLILDQGADMTVVGNSLEQMNFTTVQAAGENRILIASGVPGIVVGSKEGLMAATYSNYAQAMRRFADLTIRPLWRSACACLENGIVSVPAGSRLWFDTRGIAALQQDERDKAQAAQTKAIAIGELTRYGYQPESVAQAIEANDMSLLKHSGLAINIYSALPRATPESLQLVTPPAWAQMDPSQQPTPDLGTRPVSKPPPVQAVPKQGPGEVE
jgi:phage portal protein BeeE